MKILFVPILAVLPFPGFCQDGTVDVSFGSSGISSYTVPSGDIYNDLSKTIVLPDNRILQCFSVLNSATNNYDFGLARYNFDGQLDVTFDGDAGNGNGIVLTDFGADEVATALAVQHDGKIVVVGYKITGGTRQFALARFNSDGTLDQGFDGNTGTGNGKITTSIGLDDAAYSVAVNATRIVVAGYAYTAVAESDMAIAVYNVADGTLDNSFNANGKKTTAISGLQDVAYCVRLQSDSRIVVAGYSFDLATRTIALARYTAAGALDNSFSGDGIVTTSIGTGGFDVAYDITILPGNKILAVGSSYNGTDNDFAIARYDASGAPDNSFNGTGVKTFAFGAADDVAYSALVQTDGKIIVAGVTDNGTDFDFAIAKFTGTGSLDNSFNSSAVSPIVPGTNVIDFGGDDFGYAIAKQNSRIIFGGITGISSAMTRINNSGTYVPVRLFSFTAKKENERVELKWQTSLEENSAHFEVERSGDGEQFSKIGSVTAATNSYEKRDYQFTDLQPLRQSNFYRLKMVDADGKFSYSNILAVKLEIKPGVSVYPNPSNGILNVKVNNVASVDLVVIDVSGRVLQSRLWRAGSNQLNTSIDLSSLKPGIYFIRINGELIRFIKN